MEIDKNRMLLIKPGDILVLTEMGDTIDDVPTSLTDALKEQTGAAEVWLISGDIAVLRKEVIDNDGSPDGV
jgi:hypothetical protein